MHTQHTRGGFISVVYIRNTGKRGYIPMLHDDVDDELAELVPFFLLFGPCKRLSGVTYRKSHCPLVISPEF